MKKIRINVHYKPTSAITGKDIEKQIECIADVTVWRMTEHQLEVRLKSGVWVNIPSINILNYEVIEDE